jgi:hypothetical protein
MNNAYPDPKPRKKITVYFGKWLRFQTSSFPSGPDAEVSLQHLECRLIVVLFGAQKPDKECVAYITVEVLLPLYQVPANKHVHHCPHGCGYLKNCILQRKNILLFYKKNSIFLISRPPRKITYLQKKPSAIKKEHPHFKTWIFLLFLFLRVVFALLDPDPQINAVPCGSGSKFSKELLK